MGGGGGGGGGEGARRSEMWCTEVVQDLCAMWIL